VRLFVLLAAFVIHILVDILVNILVTSCSRILLHMHSTKMQQSIHVYIPMCMNRCFVFCLYACAPGLRNIWGGLHPGHILVSARLSLTSRWHPGLGFAGAKKRRDFYFTQLQLHIRVPGRRVGCHILAFMNMLAAIGNMERGNTSITYDFHN